jgi:preprotein translocase subunit SecE
MGADNMVEKNMKSNAGTRASDVVLWLIIVSFIAIGSYAMFLFREQISVFRLLFTFSGLTIALALAGQTSQGIQVRHYAQSAWTEMAKVVWPKPDEAKKVSIAVVCSIVVITFCIWLIDSLLTVIVRSLLG